MKRIGVFALLLASLSVFGCRKTSDPNQTAKVLSYEAAKTTLFNCGLEHGFEIKYKTNYFGFDSSEIKLGMKNNIIWSYSNIVHLNFMIDGSVESGYQKVAKEELNLYKSYGYINYIIDIKRNPDTNMVYVDPDTYYFEILDLERSPILSCPEIDDIVINSNPIGGDYTFSVNCLVDYIKYFELSNKTELLRMYFDRYIVSNHSCLFIIQRFSSLYNIPFKPIAKEEYAGRKAYKYNYKGTIDGYYYEAVGYIDIETSACLAYETFATRDGVVNRYYLETTSFLTNDNVVVPSK